MPDNLAVFTRHYRRVAFAEKDRKENKRKKKNCQKKAIRTTIFTDSTRTITIVLLLSRKNFTAPLPHLYHAPLRYVFGIIIASSSCPPDMAIVSQGALKIIQTCRFPRDPYPNFGTLKSFSNLLLWFMWAFL